MTGNVSSSLPIDDGINGFLVKMTGTGPFRMAGSDVVAKLNNTNTVGKYPSHLTFDPSSVVPIGPENSPRTLSERYWRRVA
jgi:hypothetical protein